MIRKFFVCRCFVMLDFGVYRISTVVIRMQQRMGKILETAFLLSSPWKTTIGLDPEL